MADRTQEFRVALDECYNALNEAYWAANSIEAKDNILGCISHVSDLIDVMLLADLESRNTEFARLNERIELGNKRLKKLKDDIDNLISKIDTITKVVSTIGKVLNLAQFIPGLNLV